MVILAGQDLYQARLGSLVADYDRKTLVDLYMPIVGYTAIAIYFALWANAEKADVSSVNTHENLLVSMQISTGHFVRERQKLEAIGLLKTFIDEDQDYNSYIYEIYAPKTPGSFFSNSLLYGLLIKYLGEARANKLKVFYTANKINESGKEISASFSEIFNPDFNDSAYQAALQVKKTDILDRIQSKVDCEFNYEKFINLVTSSSQIAKPVINKRVLKEIERLAALYGVNEENAAIVFIECYDPKQPSGKRIDYDKIAKQFMEENKFSFLNHNENETDSSLISSDTCLARKINWLEDVSCKEYLTIIQKGAEPVPADLRLANDLSLKQHLKPAVINAIFDYALQSNGNKLSRSYVEKLAGSVAREGLTTAYDTMVFLNDNGYTTKSFKTRKTKAEKQDIENIEEEKPQQNEKNNQSNDDFDEDEWQKMLDELGE